MPKRVIPVLSLLAAVIILLMVNFTTPAGVGPFGVLIFFAACYVVVLGVALLLVRMFTALMGKQMGHKSYLYAAVIAFGPIMLLLIESVGSLSILTVSIVVILIFLVCFLISRND